MQQVARRVEAAPMEKCWSAVDRKDWAGQVNDEINDQLQDYHMGNREVPASTAIVTTHTYESLKSARLDDSVAMPSRANPADG